jgi:hypothetical protein
MDEQSFWLVVNVELLVPLALLDDNGKTSEEYLSGCRLSAGITAQSLSSAQKRLVRLINEVTGWQREWFVVDYCRVSTLEKGEIIGKLSSTGAGENDLLQPPEMNGIWFHTPPKYQTQKGD